MVSFVIQLVIINHGCTGYKARNRNNTAVAAAVSDWVYTLDTNKQKVVNTNKSTSEIAFVVGFNSLAAFSKAFFQLTHHSPTDFKKL